MRVKCWRCRGCGFYYSGGICWHHRATCAECGGAGEITPEQAAGRTVWDSRPVVEVEEASAATAGDGDDAS